ncbi:MAG: GNAT family N-acetyltransferase [Candidatus Thorarchaeota archaeon]
MFEGTKVTLRSLELSDLDAITESWNTLEFRMNTGSAIPQSKNDLQEFIINSWDLRKNEKGYIFAIENKSSKEFLGNCSLFVINKNARSANLGVFIYKKENWNKGFGTDAMKVLLKIGFNHLNFHRIELGVYPSNERAIHVYKKIGFQEVGRKRENRYMNGNYHDEILMDILQREWFEKINNV